MMGRLRIFQDTGLPLLTWRLLKILVLPSSISRKLQIVAYGLVAKSVKRKSTAMFGGTVD